MGRIAFIGAGSMGSAILHGLLATGRSPNDFLATTHSSISGGELHKSTGIPVFSIDEAPRANRDVSQRAEILMIGVKPRAIRATLEDIAPVLTPEHIVVSLAAGVPLEDLKPLVAPATAVRAMPNTPTKVARGSVGLALPAVPTPREQSALKRIAELFSPVATVVDIPDSLISSLAGVTGSGVAYFYYLAEALINSGVSNGLSRDEVAQLVTATAEGAGRMLATGEDDAASLRRQVTSPGGTTQAAVETLTAGVSDGGLPELVETAVASAIARSREMESEW